MRKDALAALCLTVVTASWITLVPGRAGAG